MNTNAHPARGSRSRHMAGQALVEAVIVSLVLLVVLYGIVLLGKRTDIAHASIVASRYAAWERTVWSPGGKSDTQIEIEIRNRLYAATDRPLSSADGASVHAPLNPMWTRRDGSAALAAYTGGEATLTGGSGDKTPGIVFSTITEKVVDAYNTVIGLLSRVGGVDPPKFTLNVDGMYRAASQPLVRAEEVNAAAAGSPLLNIARFPEVGELRMQRRAVVLITDTWDSSQDGSAGACGSQARSSTVCQVAALTPTNVLSGWVNDVIDAVGYVVPEFKDGRFRFGYIDPVSTPAYPAGGN